MTTELDGLTPDEREELDRIEARATELRAKARRKACGCYTDPAGNQFPCSVHSETNYSSPGFYEVYF